VSPFCPFPSSFPAGFAGRFRIDGISRVKRLTRVMAEEDEGHPSFLSSVNSVEEARWGGGDGDEFGGGGEREEEQKEEAEEGGGECLLPAPSLHHSPPVSRADLVLIGFRGARGSPGLWQRKKKVTLCFLCRRAASKKHDGEEETEMALEEGVDVNLATKRHAPSWRSSVRWFRGWKRACRTGLSAARGRRLLSSGRTEKMID
jgi:hypothetical protein